MTRKGWTDDEIEDRMDGKKNEIKEAIETLIRCGVHYVQIPDVDIDFTSENIAIWIQQNILDYWICSYCGEKFKKSSGVDKPSEHAVKYDKNPILSFLSEKEKEIEELKTNLQKLKGNLSLCEVCWQILEPDGSCLACRLATSIKELEEGIKRAIGIIEGWHNINSLGRITDEEMKMAWNIYLTKSPEMIRLTNLIKK